MKYKNISKLGNIIYRFTTLLSLVMTIYFFLTDGGAGMIKKAVYALWMIVVGFGSFKVISDIIGGERRRQRSYMTMMEQWEIHQGGEAAAKRTFLLITFAAAIFKLAVPVLVMILMK